MTVLLRCAYLIEVCNKRKSTVLSIKIMLLALMESYEKNSLYRDSTVTGNPVVFIELPPNEDRTILTRSRIPNGRRQTSFIFYKHLRKEMNSGYQEQI